MTTTLSAGDSPLSHVLPHQVGPIELFSNHLIMGTIAAVLVGLMFWRLGAKMNPKGAASVDDLVVKGRFAQLLDTLCQFIYDFVAKPQLKHLADRYVPLIWTVFFFVLTCNLLGMLPIGYTAKAIATLAGAEHPETFGHWGGTATSNLSLNAALALCSFVAVIFIGIKETGFGHFVGHFNPIGWDDKKLLPIGLMLFVLEWVGLVIKCVVLAFRLFGTMLAGHLVLAVLIGLIVTAASALGNVAGYGVGLGMIVLAVAMSCLELFVAFLQAFIFAFLTTLFIAMTAVTEHHHDEHHDTDHAATPAAA